MPPRCVPERRDQPSGLIALNAFSMRIVRFPAMRLFWRQEICLLAGGSLPRVDTLTSHLVCMFIGMFARHLTPHRPADDRNARLFLRRRNQERVGGRRWGRGHVAGGKAAQRILNAGDQNVQQFVKKA